MAIVPSELVSIRAACITEIGQYPGRSSADLAKEALETALRAAEMKPSGIDGFVWNMGSPFGADYDAMCVELGLSPRFVTQTWTHGRFTGTCVALAAMAVTSGAASTVACIGGIKGRPYLGEVEASRKGAGQEVSVRPAATALAKYLEMYGVDRDRLADVALTARKYASLNPRAYLRGAMSAADYAASPMVIDPLKEADCYPTDEAGSVINDCGVCVILTKGPAAAGESGVYFLAGQGIQGGPEEVYFGRPGLGAEPHAFEPSERDLAAFSATNLVPGDMHGFFTYDAFAPAVWFALERFGYCRPGDAPRWATMDRMWLGGELPVNTNGGLLSAGHTSGWDQIVEMVAQLRGEAGPRQIAGAELLHWGTVFGDALILTNNPDRCRQSVESARSGARKEAGYRGRQRPHEV